MKTIKDIRHENLMLVIKELGTQQALADLLERSHAQINQLVTRAIVSATGNRRSVSEKMAREIELKANKPAGWMDTDHNEDNVSPAINLLNSDRVPLISWVQAGDWCDVVDLFQPSDAQDWLYCPVSHSKITYALTVHGLSMYNPVSSPSFNEGDTIFVDPERNHHNQSLVIAKETKTENVTFKQLIIEDGLKFLRPLNPNWPKKIIDLTEDYIICGVVIAKLEIFY